MRSIEEGIVCSLCGEQWSTHGTACKPKTVMAEPLKLPNDVIADVFLRSALDAIRDKNLVSASRLVAAALTHLLAPSKPPNGGSEVGSTDWLDALEQHRQELKALYVEQRKYQEEARTRAEIWMDAEMRLDMVIHRLKNPRI